MQITKNNQVACGAFPEDAIKVPGKGLAIVTKKAVLVPLPVLVPADLRPLIGFLRPGDTVYVNAKSANQQWAKEKLTFYGDTTEFILVPMNEIVAVDLVEGE